MFCPNPINFLSLKVQYHEYTIWLPITCNIMGDKLCSNFFVFRILGLYHIDWELHALKGSELKFWIKLLTVRMTWPNTVESVLSGHPRGMAKWPLNTGWLPNTGCKKYTSKNLTSIVWPQIGTFISSVLMICKNKQGNHLAPCVLQYLKLYEQVILYDRLIRVKTIEKVPLGLY